jgi:photosystem II stability/assembly factor-like uncharacterized protein
MGTSSDLNQYIETGTNYGSDITEFTPNGTIYYGPGKLIVGNGGTIKLYALTFGGGTYNPNVMTPISTGTSNNLYSIVDVDNYGYMAVGANGTVIVGNASNIDSWTLRTSNTSADLYSVVNGPDGNIWAFGDGGVVIRSNNNGVNWTAITSNVSSNFSNLTLGAAAGYLGATPTARDGLSNYL